MAANRSVNFRWWSGIAAVAVLACIAYWPGLSGGFLFDDHVNLDALGRYGVVDNWPVFWRYITSGTADPIGRPIALLSFLLDARDWPADPAAFLRTNLLIHVLNGVLLGQLLLHLGQAVGDDRSRAQFSALLGSALWLLHPLLVSTTLYAVQREAMLPATFTLLGLIAYAHGRTAYAHSAGRGGLVLLAVGICAGTVLATLSKANGILLPLLAGILEVTIFRRMPLNPAATHRLRVTLSLIILIPAAGVLYYILTPLGDLARIPANRPWSIGQRLLTEPRVLLDYLQLLVVPRSVSAGLFNDGYVASKSLLVPASTLPAVIVVLALPLLAWLFRNRFPAAACAILFYFTGHLLESTTLPLELYFEHRNYLPAMLLFWPLGRAIAASRLGWSAKGLIACTLSCLMAVTTFQRSTLWGQPAKLAELWAIANPQSSRSQVSAAIQANAKGRPREALALLEAEWRRRPFELQVAFNVVNVRCTLGSLPADVAPRVTRALHNTDVGALLMYQWLAKATDVAASGRCQGLDLDLVDGWVDAAEQNPRLGTAGQKAQDLEPIRALVSLRRHDATGALAHFNAALAARVSPDLAARQVVMLASAGYFQEALRHLDEYEALSPRARKASGGMRRLHEWVLERQGYWPRELGLLRQQLRAEIRKGALDRREAPIHGG